MLGPDHSVEGARYGDSFRALVVTSNCADAIVQADETSLKMQKPNSVASSGPSSPRSSSRMSSPVEAERRPRRCSGASTGTLVVDIPTT